MKIGLLSDTHGYLDASIFPHFQSCDEIWHAGDIGDPGVTDQLMNFKPLKAVYGNIDGRELREQFPENLDFACAGAKVLMTHIGGKPPRYNKEARRLIHEFQPDIFVCGHSHILRVIYDNERKLLYLNPGALGRQGFHKIRTALRFEILKGQAKNMEVIELGNR